MEAPAAVAPFRRNQVMGIRRRWPLHQEGTTFFCPPILNAHFSELVLGIPWHAQALWHTPPMTRINLVPPAELCDQHLLAEHRELTRIPNAVARGRFSLVGQPADYVLGTGHVRFFFDKLAFLQQRHRALHAECLARGFRVNDIWPAALPDDPSLWQDYVPTPAALQLNRQRLAERMPARARFTPPRPFLPTGLVTGQGNSERPQGYSE